jgi:hypothetical protein
MNDLVSVTNMAGTGEKISNRLKPKKIVDAPGRLGELERLLG